MNKSQKCLLLSLVSLSLFACNRMHSSSSSDNASSSAPSSEQISSSSASSEKPSSNPISSDATSSSEKDSSSSSSSETVPSDFNGSYANDVKEEMQKHLGLVLPYIPLGKNSEISGGWERGTTDLGSYHLTGTKEFDSSILTPVKTVFEKAGFVTVLENDSVKATMASKKLTVKVFGEAIVSSDETKMLQISATREETYDDSVSITTSWDDTVQYQLDSHFTDPSNKLPFVYLGTNCNYATYWYSEENEMEIFGGLWDDRIASKGKADLEALGYTVSESSGAQKFVAVQNGDGGKYTITLTKRGINVYEDDHVTSRRVDIAVLKVSYTAGSTPSPTQGQWDEDIKEYFTEKFDGHTIPYINLGTDTPSSNFSDNQKMLTISGAATQDDVFTAAKTAFAKDSSDWKVYDEGTVSYNGSSYLAVYRKFSDGKYLHIYLQKDRNSSYSIAATYTDTYASSGTNYGSSNISTLNGKLDNHASEFPYVYLGNNVTIDEESYPDHTSELYLKGGRLTEGMIDELLAKLDNTWTVTIKGTYYGRSVEATKTLSDKCVLYVSMNASTDDNGAQITFAYDQGFDYKENLTWSDEILSAMDKKLYGYRLPYVYLGMDSPYCKTGQEFELEGGIWNDEVLTTAKKDLVKATGFAITDDNFDVDDYYKTLELDAENSSGDKLHVEIYEESGHIKLKATYTIGYKLPEESAMVWSDTTKQAIESFTGGTEIPYIYLNTTNPTPYMPDDSSYFFLSGYSFDEQIVTQAKTALSNADFTVKDGTYNNAIMVSAMKVKEDGSLIRLAVYKGQTGAAELKIYHDTDAIPEGTAWDAEVSSQLTANGVNMNLLPYFYTGCKSVTSKTDRYYTGQKYSMMSSTSWKSMYTYNAMKVLKKNGFECEFSPVGDVDANQPLLLASKTTDNGETLNVNVVPYLSTGAYIYIYYGKYDASSSAVTGWKQEISDVFTSNFNGLSVPYFFFGATSNDQISCSYLKIRKTLSIQGGVWNKKTFDNCKAALKADTNLTWTITDPTDENPVLTATGVDASGNKLTLTISKIDSGNNYYGTETTSITVSYKAA